LECFAAKSQLGEQQKLRSLLSSRLFLRLQGAGDQFAAAAGLPPDMNFFNAGRRYGRAPWHSTTSASFNFSILRSCLREFDAIRALADARKIETRSAAGITFYVRRDPESEREVAFAASGDYLILATREDLLAGALQLLAGGKGPHYRS